MRTVMWVVFALVIGFFGIVHGYEKLTEAKVSCGYQMMDQGDRCEETWRSSTVVHSYDDQRSSNRVAGVIEMLVCGLIGLGGLGYGIVRVVRTIEVRREGSQSANGVTVTYEQEQACEITYEQACEIVYQAMRPGWAPGTFCLDDRRVVETDHYYVVVVGPREWIIDKDIHFTFPPGKPATVVDKQSGEIRQLHGRAVAYDPTWRISDNPNPRFLLSE
ncbi:hypothetical protein [Nocardia tengchongensis]